MTITPQLTWEIGTAYDLFTSLNVVHDPARYGLRGSWAAGVRSRLPAEQREFLQGAVEKHHFWAIPWLANQDGPKNSAAILKKLAEIPAENRMKELSACYMDESWQALLFRVAEQGMWDAKDKKQLRSLYTEMYRKESGKSKKISDDELVATLNIWADTAVVGVRLAASAAANRRCSRRRRARPISS